MWTRHVQPGQKVGAICPILFKRVPCKVLAELCCKSYLIHSRTPATLSCVSVTRLGAADELTGAARRCRPACCSSAVRSSPAPSRRPQPDRAPPSAGSGGRLAPRSLGTRGAAPGVPGSQVGVGRHRDLECERGVGKAHMEEAPIFDDGALCLWHADANGRGTFGKERRR